PITVTLAHGQLRRSSMFIDNRKGMTTSSFRSEIFPEKRRVVMIASYFTKKSFNPVGDENVRLARFRRVPIPSKHQLLAIRREHRKPIKSSVVSDALHVPPV